MKFTTLLAGNLHEVTATIDEFGEVSIDHVSDGGVKAAGRQRAAVMRRLQTEARDYVAHSYNGWFNGADFKEYFKIRAEQGGSLVFEVADYEVYCNEARRAAEENFDEAEAYYGSNV